jgi:hypothetical protein
MASAGRLASRGDVIVLPYGDDYLMGGNQPAQVVPIMTLMAGPPWEQMPVLEYGAGGDRTDIVCGHMYSEDPLFDPAMRAFPPVFVVRVPDGPAARGVASSINYALAVTTESLRRRRRRPDCPSCYSPKSCGYIWRRPRSPSMAGSRR